MRKSRLPLHWKATTRVTDWPFRLSNQGWCLSFGILLLILLLHLLDWSLSARMTTHDLLECLSWFASRAARRGQARRWRPGTTHGLRSWHGSATTSAWREVDVMAWRGYLHHRWTQQWLRLGVWACETLTRVTPLGSRDREGPEQIVN